MDAFACHRVSVVVLCVTLCAQAAVFYESSSYVPADPGGSSGLLVDDSFFAGVNFEVTQDVRLGRVGGHFDSFVDAPIFAAIVELTGEFDFPNEPDLSADDVLMTTLIYPGSEAGIYGSNIDITLEPGWYALVFGAGIFGAEGGDAAAIGENDPIAGINFYTIIQSTGQVVFQTAVPYYVLETFEYPRLTKLVDTSTEMPGVGANFTSFGRASLRDGYVTFRGYNSSLPDSPNGVYGMSLQDAGSVPDRIADTLTDIPGGTGTFRSFGFQPNTSNGDVVLQGRGDQQAGIYKWHNNMLSRMADLTTTPPESPDHFTTVYPVPAIHNGEVAFMGVFGDEDTGVFAHTDGEGLRVIADQNTLAPDGLGVLDLLILSYVSIENGVVNFRGGRLAAEVFQQIITTPTGFEVLDNFMDPMPAGTTDIGYFSHAAQHDGNLAYLLLDDLGAPTEIALSTFIDGVRTDELLSDVMVPGTENTPFDAIFEPSFDGRHVAFMSTYGEEEIGAFTNITGEWTRIITSEDELEGHDLDGVQVGWEALDDYTLVIQVRSSDDEWSAIYAVEFELPATGACCHGDGTCADDVEEPLCQSFVCDVTDYLPETFAGCYGDLNGDGVVTPLDRGFVAANLLTEEPINLCLYDVNGNGVVEPADRGFIAANIGECTGLPDFMNGSGLNGGAPDPRFGQSFWQGQGSTCAESCLPTG